MNKEEEETGVRGQEEWEVGGEVESEGKGGGAAPPETDHMLEDIVTQKACHQERRKLIISLAELSSLRMVQANLHETVYCQTSKVGGARRLALVLIHELVLVYWVCVARLW